MLSIKLHEATREFKISNKLAMFFLEKLDIPVKSHKSDITIEQLELLREFSGDKEKYSHIWEEFNRIEKEKKKRKTKEDLSKIGEAKLVVVGDGGVGKTSLIKRLLEKEFNINPSELLTFGIDFRKWELMVGNNRYIRINCWTFGGQDIFHATPQLFLTKNSLYIFVWEARKSDDMAHFYYWLNTIEVLTESAPVIIVLNKIDVRV